MAAFLHLDLVEQQGGTEKPPEGLWQQKCPRCGGDTAQSFGLFGGGYGPYVYCEAEPTPGAARCDWFYKEQFSTEEA